MLVKTGEVRVAMALLVVTVIEERKRQVGVRLVFSEEFKHAIVSSLLFFFGGSTVGERVRAGDDGAVG
jgi:hypothetical protein